MSEQPNGSHREHFIIDASDGRGIDVLHWQPATAAKAVVQLLHGLSEHAGRYERFARACCAAGLAVVAHNHRGHGEACEPGDLGHFADQDGWGKVLDDVALVHAAARERHADQPLLLFGHSMGSYIAQAFVMRQPDAATRLLLSGSTSVPWLQLSLGRLAAWLEARRHGPRYRSPLLQSQAFGAYNRRFVPVRTQFDWLSRDQAEVDRYVHDPHCGAVPSARLWQDLLGGLACIRRRRSLCAVPASLPILIVGGGDDPVGGRKGMQRLAKAYAKTGHRKVTLEVYDGGRHEMLNETNRDEFTEFVIEWMLAK